LASTETGIQPTSAERKTPRAIWNAVVQVYEELGGEAALVEWTKTHRTAFYQLAALLMPRAAGGIRALAAPADTPLSTGDERPRRARRRPN
jgi:hypothetical protein